MTIQRQYSLPNCVLTLEGMDSLAEVGEARPTLSVLLTVNCQFPAHGQGFLCDRSFFERFAQVVSQYAQGCFSGIQSPQLPTAIDPSQPNVAVVAADGGKHRLLVMPPPNPEGPGDGPPQPIELLLTPLQLFDLVETIDQFYGDPKTLPDIQQVFSPVSRHDLVQAEPLVQRAAPVALGASGLAVAAGLLFMLPVPKVQQPKDLLRPTPTPTPQNQSALPAPSPATAPSPTKPQTQTRSLPAASPASTSAAIPPSSVPVPSPLAGEGADTLLTPAKPVTDPKQLAALERYLLGQLDQAWTDRQNLALTLNYRVSVGEDGSIVGYLPENAMAQEAIARTPLPKLLFKPLDRANTGEPLATFQVSFNAAQGVQVIPMESVNASNAAVNRIQNPSLSDAIARETARAQLEKSLRTAWQGKSAPSMPLMYDVRTNAVGIAVDADPANRNAAQKPFPLGPLLNPAASAIKGDNGKVQLAPLAQFRVVFWPDGSIDVRS